MTKKAKRNELIAVKVMHEQRWAFEQRLAHLSYRDMRVKASLPPARGGLGYDVSEHRLKGLVTGYRERMAEVDAIELDEHRERELHDLDVVQRLALASMQKAASLEALDVHGTGIFLKAGAERRKLLGLDAPQQIKAEVVVKDAVTEELNAMLERAGRKPIKVES